ncbi:uncharacterized protein LOC135709178 [Ochlerotatus camptorhynchus]|uniref:uncharacterized protein LOC135709178 n=1 Tax=Ochlerotatus camptorhynchus TaxID=644619 RepID=UPI0031D2F32B
MSEKCLPSIKTWSICDSVCCGDFQVCTDVGGYAGSLASTNNHQLSSSISPPGADSSGSSRSKSSSISTSSISSSRRSQSWPQHQHQQQQHVDGEGKLIDNKLRDKLLSYISSSSSQGGRRYRRAKRGESIFTEDKINKYYDNRISDEQPLQRGKTVPSITEEVLQISNLTEERIREENELLDHLNQENFSESSSSAAGIRLTEETDGTGAPRKKHPGGGKKGRRRKGHKKKIKRIKPTAGSSSDSSWNSNAPSAKENQRGTEEQINSSLTSVTKLSLNESEQQQKQNHKPGWKKPRQKSSSQLTAGAGSQRKMTSTKKSSIRSGRRDENWARKAGQELVVLNSDDIYDGNMQITVQRDAATEERNEAGGVREMINLSDEGDRWRQHQKDQQQRKPTPAERRQKKLEKQRKQLKKFMKGDLVLMPPPEQLQQLPPAPATEPNPRVSSVTFASDDMLRTEAVSLQRIIIVGDLSCMKDDFIPAPAIPNADIKYLRNDVYGLENSFLEAEYHCRLRYELRYPNVNGNNSNLICRKSRWIGKRPSCVRIKKPSLSLSSSSSSSSSSSMASFSLNEVTTADGNSAIFPGNQDNDKNLCGKKHNCQQACYMLHNATRVCSCFKGFKMVDGRCVDINECTEYGEDVCEYGCSNTIGSFTCKCPKGLRVTDNNKCMDVNECLLRNGHGPCQDTCINTWSGYRCSCSGLPGTRLSDDGHSCEDIDECTVNNGGCSHTCLNTLGRAFCVCPEGYMLDDDWKTCIDIDECLNQKSIRQEFRCRENCVNTIGSYRCLLEDVVEGRPAGAGLDYDDRLTKQVDDELDDENDDDTLCPMGYYFNTTMGDCQDTNECSQGNGGCQHHCINSDGSFYCSCKYGFKLDVDKHNCLVLNDSLKLADVACPPLFPPRHGYLECSRPIDEISDGPNGGRLKIINRPGSQCILKCPTGYRLEGKYSKICGTTGEWIGDESGTCIRYPQPKLTCPTSVNVELHPNETDQTAVKLRRPKTDVSWERDIVVEPFWAKKDVLLLPLGPVNISYTAKHPVSKLTSSCTFVVNVMAGRPPTVDFCPDTQIYTIEGRHQSVKATWEEPIFSDNVGVVTITKSNSPGTDFGAGSHLITYEAHDEAEWSSKCVFKIVVNVSKRKDVQHFQLPILYNRFYF